jgi:plastocyanin
LVFSIGTIVPLFFLFFTSQKLNNNHRLSAYFSQVIGILLLVFSLYSLNASLNLLNLPSISFAQNIQSSTSDVLKMTATATGYTPNYFKVKAGAKIRWEITDMGSSGCTNAVISRSLLDEPIHLVPGTTSVREFTAPTAPGIYRFSCWMGMISGTIEVVP